MKKVSTALSGIIVLVCLAHKATGLALSRSAGVPSTHTQPAVIVAGDKLATCTASHCLWEALPCAIDSVCGDLFLNIQRGMLHDMDDDMDIKLATSIATLMMPGAMCSDKHCGTSVVAAITNTNTSDTLLVVHQEVRQRRATSCNAHRVCCSDTSCPPPLTGVEFCNSNGFCEICATCADSRSISGVCPQKCNEAMSATEGPQTSTTTTRSVTHVVATLKHIANWGSLTHPGGPDGDPDVRHWRNWTSLPSRTAEASMGLIDNKLYLVGQGIGGSAFTTNVFNLATGEWTTAAERIYTIGDHHGTVTYRGEWILIGGFSHFSDGQAVVRKMQIFNPTENAWREGPEYPGIGKGSYATAVLGDQIYVCSGLYYQSFSTLYDHTASSGNQNPRDCYRYSGDERTWYRVPDMLVGVNHAAAGTDGNKFYVFGGRTLTANQLGNGIATVQIYNPDTMTWSYGPDMPIARGGMGNAPYLNGKFYIIGGECTSSPYEVDNNNVIGSVTTYDPITRVWAFEESLPIAVHGMWPLADPVRNMIYVVGGGIKGGLSMSGTFQVMVSDDDVDAALESTTSTTSASITTQAAIVEPTTQQSASTSSSESSSFSSSGGSADGEDQDSTVLPTTTATITPSLICTSELEATFLSNFGGCSSYASGLGNHVHCAEDVDASTGCAAMDVCIECGARPMVEVATASRLSCAELGWPFKGHGNTEVCAQSVMDGNVCHINSQTYAQAAHTCAYAGGRLCSADELLANRAWGTGCGNDWRMIWTRSVCDGGMLTRLGANDANPAVCVTNLNSLYSVRCCADSAPTTTAAVALTSSTIVTSTAQLERSTTAAATTALGQFFSSSTCAELGWGFGSGHTAVCAASVFDGTCHKNTDTYAEAVELCVGQGARLCTADELQANVARGTGCSIDWQLTWTLTACEGGVLLRKGADDGLDGVCETNLESRRSVRCCADVPTTTTSPITEVTTIPVVSSHTCENLGWGYRWLNTDVCSQSSLGGVCHADSKTHAQANELCVAEGGRLCTSSELQADVTRGSGCSLDWKRVWSQTTCAGGGMISRIGSNPQNLIQYGEDGVCETDLNKLLSVRCCADASTTLGGLGGDDASTTLEVVDITTTSVSEAVTTAPDSNSRSSSSCAALGWNYNWGNTEVCGSSLATCNYASSHLEANQLCVGTGGRLCTSIELGSYAAASTGCGIDTKLTWTSTSCGSESESESVGGGHIVRMGSPTGGEITICASDAGEYAVRCCADP